jgi:hypothetical protein
MTDSAMERVETIEERNTRHISELQMKVIDRSSGHDQTLATHRADIEQLRDQIAELQRTVDDLIAGEGVTAIKAFPDAPPVIEYAPQIRVRLQHSSTVKEGWRLSESTVEYTSGSDGAVDWARIKNEMLIAGIAGTKEAESRNAESA